MHGRMARLLGLKIAYKHKVDVIGDLRRASKFFPGVHRVFSLLRRLILGTYHGSWSRKWAALYCEEFTFRFNRRTACTRTHLFRRALEGALRRAPRIHLLTGEARTASVVPA